MGAKWKYFKTICKHKAVVFHECKKCGITWRGLIHDLSKFSPSEFSASAKYYNNEKGSVNKDSCGYTEAWLHHKGINKHHWEWWIDFGSNGEIIANKIPSKYVVEMLCDWIGAGKVYENTKWTQSSPLEYYNKVRKGRYFHPETEKLILYLLELIRDKGLDEFHRVCLQGYPVLTDYDNIYIP